MSKNYIDPLARIESDHIGDNCTFWAGVHVLKGAVIGNDCKFGEHCFIENRVVIGNQVTVKNNVCLWDGITINDRVFIGPNAVFTNDLVPRSWNEFTESMIVPTYIKQGATIGAHATIICGYTIGEYSFVGAGSVVTRDVLAHEKVFGNPARHQGFVCACGLDLTQKDSSHWTCSCGNHYENIDSSK